MKLIINNLVIILVTIILTKCLLSVCGSALDNKYHLNKNRPYHRSFKSYAYSSSQANESPEDNSNSSMKNTTDIDVFCDEPRTKLIGGGKLVKIKANRKCKNNFIGLRQHPRHKQYYYICQPNRILLGRCQNRKIYNDTYKCCVSKANCATTPLEYDEPKRKFNVSKCYASGIFPIEGAIRHYYTCVYLRGRFIQKICKCPRGTIFNSTTGTCVERVKCAPPMKTRKELDSVERFKPTTEMIRHRKYVNSNEYLPCDTPGTYSTDDNPNYYYKCCVNREGKYFKMKLKCPSGKSFDSSSKECVTNSDYFTKFPQNSIGKIIQHKKRDLITNLPRLLTAHRRRRAKQTESFDAADYSDSTEEETIKPIVNKKFCGCMGVNKYAHEKQNTDSSQLHNTKEIEQIDGTFERQPNRIKYGSDYENGYAEFSAQIQNSDNNRSPKNIRSGHHCHCKFGPRINSATTSTVKCKLEQPINTSSSTSLVNSPSNPMAKSKEQTNSNISEEELTVPECTIIATTLKRKSNTTNSTLEQSDTDNLTTSRLEERNTTISKQIPPILVLVSLRSNMQNASVLTEKEATLSTSRMAKPEAQKTIISNDTEPNTAESNTIVSIMKSALIPNSNSKQLSFQKPTSKEKQPTLISIDTSTEGSAPIKSNVPITNLATSTRIPTNLNSAEPDISALASTTEDNNMSSLMLSAEESAILIPISASSEESQTNNAGFTSLSSKHNTNTGNPTTFNPLTTQMTTNKTTIEERTSETDRNAFLVTTPVPSIFEESDSSSVNSPKLDTTTPIPTTTLSEQSNINSFTTTSVTRSYSLDEELTSTTPSPSENNMITKTPNPTTWTTNTTPQIQIAIKTSVLNISEESNSTGIAAPPLSTPPVYSSNLDPTTPIPTTDSSEESNINSITTTSVTRSYSLDTTLAEELTSTTPPPSEDNMITKMSNPTTWTPNTTTQIQMATTKATDDILWSTISSSELSDFSNLQHLKTLVPSTTPIPQASTTSLFRISVESSETPAPTPKKLLTDSKSQTASDNAKSVLILSQEVSNLPSIITTSTIQPDRTFSQTTPPTSKKTTLEEISTKVTSEQTDSTLDPLSKTTSQGFINSYFMTASGQSNTDSLSTANIADLASTPNPFIYKKSDATTATTESVLTTYNPSSSIDLYNLETSEQEATTKFPILASNELATTSKEGLTTPEITTTSATSEGDSAETNNKNIDRNLGDDHSELGIDTESSKATTNSTNISFLDDDNYNGSNISQNIEGHLNNIPEKGSGNGSNNYLGSEVGDSSEEYDLKEMQLKMNGNNTKDDREYDQNDLNLGIASNRLTGSMNPDKKSNDKNFEFMSEESPGSLNSDELIERTKENKSPRKFSGENIKLPEIADSEILGNYESQEPSVDTVKVASTEDHNFDLRSLNENKKDEDRKEKSNKQDLNSFVHKSYDLPNNSSNTSNESGISNQSTKISSPPEELFKLLSELVDNRRINQPSEKHNNGPDVDDNGFDLIPKKTKDIKFVGIQSKDDKKLQEITGSSIIGNYEPRAVSKATEDQITKQISFKNVEANKSKEMGSSKSNLLNESAEHLQILQPFEDQNDTVEDKSNSNNSNESNENQKNNLDLVNDLVKPNISAQKKALKENAEQNGSTSKLPSDEGKSQPHNKMKDDDVSNETFILGASTDSPFTVKIDERRNKSSDPKIDSANSNTNDQSPLSFEDTTKDKDSDLLADNISKENNMSSSKSNSLSSKNSELNTSYEIETSNPDDSTKSERKLIHESTKSNPNSSNYPQILQPSKKLKNATENKMNIEKPNESNLSKDNKSEDDPGNDSYKSKASGQNKTIDISTAMKQSTLLASPSKSSDKIKSQSIDQIEDDTFSKNRNKSNDTTDKRVGPTEDTSTDKTSDFSGDIQAKEISESTESLTTKQQIASMKNTNAMKSKERTNHEENLNSFEKPNGSKTGTQSKGIANTKTGNQSASKPHAEQNDGPSKISDEDKSQPHDKIKNDDVSSKSVIYEISNDSPVKVKIDENRNKYDDPKIDLVNSSTNDQRPQNKIDFNENFELLSNKSLVPFEDTAKEKDSDLLVDNMSKENKSSSKSTSLSSKHSELNTNSEIETSNLDDLIKNDRKIIHESEIISNGKEKSTESNLNNSDYLQIIQPSKKQSNATEVNQYIEKPNESNLGKDNESEDDLVNDSDKSKASAAEQNVSPFKSSDKIKSQSLDQTQDDEFSKNRNKSNDTTDKRIEPTEDISTDKISDFSADIQEKKLPESTELLTIENKERQEVSEATVGYSVPGKLTQQIEKQNNAAEDKNGNKKPNESKTDTQNKRIGNTKASNESITKPTAEQNDSPSKLSDEDQPQPHDKIKNDNVSNETVIPEASNDSPITVKINENRNKSDGFKPDSVNSNANDQSSHKKIDINENFGLLSNTSPVPFEETTKDKDPDQLADEMAKENKSSSKTKSLSSQNSEHNTNNKIETSNPDSEITSNGKEKSAKGNLTNSDYVQIPQSSKKEKNASEDKKYIEKPNEPNLSKDNESDKSKSSAQYTARKQPIIQATAEQNVSSSKSSDKIKSQQASNDSLITIKIDKNRNKSNETTDRRVEPTEDSSKDKNADLLSDIPKENKLNTTQSERARKLTESTESLIIDNKEPQEVSKTKLKERTNNEDKVNSSEHLQNLKLSEKQNNATEDKNGNKKPNGSKTGTQNKITENTKGGNQSASKPSAQQNVGPPKSSDKSKSQPDEKTKDVTLLNENITPEATNDSPVAIKIDSSPLSTQRNEDGSLMRANDEIVFNPFSSNCPYNMQPVEDQCEAPSDSNAYLNKLLENFDDLSKYIFQARNAMMGAVA